MAALTRVDQMIHRFHQRCPRVLQEERKFRRRKTTKTFRDVARRRCTRAAYLIAVLEVARNGIAFAPMPDLAFQFVGEFPADEISEVANAGHGLRKGTRRASVDYMKIPGTSTRPVRERPEYCGIRVTASRGFGS